MRQWGEEGAGSGQFNQPCGVAVVEGEVIVCDTFNHRMQVFGWDGTFLRQWGVEGAGPGQFSGPSGVAVKRNVAASNRVQVFGLDGICAAVGRLGSWAGAVQTPLWCCGGGR